VLLGLLGPGGWLWNLLGTHRFDTGSHSSLGPQLPELPELLLNGVLALPFMSLRKPPLAEPRDDAGWFDALATVVFGCFRADVFVAIFGAPPLGLLASADFDEVPVLPAFDWASAEGLAALELILFELDLFELESDELDLLGLESAELDLLGFENDDDGFGFVRLEDDDEDRFVLLLPQLLLDP